MRGVYAEMGVTMVIESFVVVVVGGMGSLLGAVVAGLLIGPGREPHHVLRAQARRDHGLRRHGGRPAGAAERPLRRGRAWWSEPRACARVVAAVAAHPCSAFAVFFAVFPFLVPYKALATQVLIFGLFALGFNLLYGYTGLLSFGHAAYYGLGAYGTGIALAKLKVASLWLARSAPGSLLAGRGRARSSASSACAGAASTSRCSRWPSPSCSTSSASTWPT